MGVPIERVGEMPWWAHRNAVEGLLWEQPWLPKFEQVEVPDRHHFDFDDGDSVGDEGVFVGVRPEGR